MDIAYSIPEVGVDIDTAAGGELQNMELLPSGLLQHTFWVAPVAHAPIAVDKLSSLLAEESAASI
jgi:hypothetical protein